MLAGVLSRTNVTTLTLQGTCIGGAGLRALSAAIPQSAVRALRLVQNRILNGTILSELGSAMQTLEELEVSGEVLGDAGAAAIAGVIRRSSLATLTLNAAGIGDWEVAILAEAIDGSAISALSLRENLVTAAAVAPLSRAIRGESSVRSLDLSGNAEMGVSGASAMALAMLDSSLRALSIASIPLRSDGQQQRRQRRQ